MLPPPAAISKLPSDSATPYRLQLHSACMPLLLLPPPLLLATLFSHLETDTCSHS
jgi:hypothetical protein